MKDKKNQNKKQQDDRKNADSKAYANTVCYKHNNKEAIIWRQWRQQQQKIIRTKASRADVLRENRGTTQKSLKNQPRIAVIIIAFVYMVQQQYSCYNGPLCEKLYIFLWMLARRTWYNEILKKGRTTSRKNKKAQEREKEREETDGENQRNNKTRVWVLWTIKGAELWSH